MDELLGRIEEFLGLADGTVWTVIWKGILNLGIALLIFAIGFWLANRLSRALRKLLDLRDVDAGLSSFVVSFTRIAIKLLTVALVFSQLGVELSSFVAIFAAAGFALGMAFSGTLSNLAGGIMILVFRPFRVGDLVQMQGEFGVVSQILMFNTYIKSTDNKLIILPNGPVANGNIVNYTREEIRRVDWTIGIAYGDDLKKAKEVIDGFFKEESRILDDPSTLIALGELADSSVNIVARAWVNTEDYWDVYYAINERVYNEFPANGLSIPFPQMDVHIQNKN